MYIHFSDIKDVADYITENLIDQSKTRRQVVKQLIRQNLIGSSKDLYQAKKGSSKFKWMEHEEVELRQLFEQHKDAKGT